MRRGRAVVPAHRVVHESSAQEDFVRIYDFVADESGPERALGFVSRLRRRCDGLATFPSRGMRRDDLRPGLRITGFERRASIVFVVTEAEVNILRVLYGGRDVEGALRAP